jgi:hypothetical protein
MSVYIRVELQRQIRDRFGECCAYCRTAEFLTAMTFEFEHIIPLAVGGKRYLKIFVLPVLLVIATREIVRLLSIPTAVKQLRYFIPVEIEIDRDPKLNRSSIPAILTPRQLQKT